MAVATAAATVATDLGVYSAAATYNISGAWAQLIKP